MQNSLSRNSLRRAVLGNSHEQLEMLCYSESLEVLNSSPSTPERFRQTVRTCMQKSHYSGVVSKEAVSTTMEKFAHQVVKSSSLDLSSTCTSDQSSLRWDYSRLLSYRNIVLSKAFDVSVPAERTHSLQQPMRAPYILSERAGTCSSWKPIA